MSSYALVDVDNALPFDLPPLYSVEATEIEEDVRDVDLVHSYSTGNLAVARRLEGKITRPICLPQLERGFDTPFARGYATVLDERGISQDTFINFVDRLNAALIASPPLQVVGLVGIVIGFIPFDVCSIISATLQVGAQIGIRVLSKTLTDRCLRDANERIFAPAGLRARLCKTPAMRALAKVPWVVPPSKPCFRLSFKRKTKASKDAALPPMGEKDSRMVTEKKTTLEPPKIDPTISDPLKRRITQYEGYIQPLEFDVPPPRRPTSIIVRLSDYSVRVRTMGLKKKAANEAARRQLLAGVPVTRELTWSDRRVMKMLAKGKEDEVKKAVEKGDKRERKDNENVLWLVILTEDEDRIIQGSERVDDSKDEIVFSEKEIEMARKEYETELIRDG